MVRAAVAAGAHREGVLPGVEVRAQLGGRLGELGFQPLDHLMSSGSVRSRHDLYRQTPWRAADAAIGPLAKRVRLRFALVATSAARCDAAGRTARRLVERATRWLLRSRPRPLDIRE